MLVNINKGDPAPCPGNLGIWSRAIPGPYECLPNLGIFGVLLKNLGAALVCINLVAG